MTEALQLDTKVDFHGHSHPPACYKHKTKLHVPDTRQGVWATVSLVFNHI